MRGDGDIEGDEGLSCTEPQQKCGVTVTIAKQGGSMGTEKYEGIGGARPQQECGITRHL